jgi:hypothetical protein
MEDEEELTSEDYYAMMMLNSQFRIYDAILSLLAATADAETAKALQSIHEKGEFLYPPPYFDEEEV